MEPVAFHIEDELDSTTTVEKTLRELNVATVVAHSTAAAWPIAESGRFDFALIDQRLPLEDNGIVTASDEQVYELAYKVGEVAPFLWLTAHVLSARSLQIPNCKGSIQKAGGIEDEVMEWTQEVLPDLRPKIYLDEVMVELRNTGSGDFLARVLTWKPDCEFVVPSGQLEPWVVGEVRNQDRQFFKARAWLGAARPGQLDLTDWEPMPQPSGQDLIWDD